MKTLLLRLLRLLILVAALPALAAESTGAPVSATFAPTTADVPNPERGFYGGGSGVPPYFFLQDFSADTLAYTRDGLGLRLVIGVLNLAAYVGTDTIDPALINSVLPAKFALLRAAGMKVILRPAYNYDQSGNDADAARIAAHMAQLRGVLNDNADVIAFVQVGLVGNYGEWFRSNTFGHGILSPSISALREVQSAVRNNLNPRTYQQVRFPRFNYAWFPTPLNAADAFSGTEQALTGSHNDCFLASNNDVGTFASSDLTLAGNPERARLAAESNWLPYGGETCSGFSPQRASCSPTSGIMADGPAYHLIYLNIHFDKTFINQWKSEGCYDTVRRQMGYRFRLDTITHPGTAAPRQTLDFDVQMRNEGWARVFSERHLQVRLMAGSNVAASAMSSVDLRTLPPQATASERVSVKGLVAPAPGTYAVELCSPDVWPSIANDARYKIRFANADTRAQSYNAKTGCFRSGTSVVVN
jgi:hypothetical protein